MADDRERGALARPLWPELLVRESTRARRDEFMLALLAGVGGFLGVLVGATVLVCLREWLDHPAEGPLLLTRVALVIPVPVLLGGRAALEFGELLLRRVQRA